jgi:hypothetical protein
MAEHIRALEAKLEERKDLFEHYKEKLKLLQEKDIEYKKLLSYWETFHRATYVYIPVRDDPVDRLLADFINCADVSKKAKCLFVREQPGVYSFFHKRLVMKAELGKLSIRVGGGYISLEDYIEHNNPWE